MSKADTSTESEQSEHLTGAWYSLKCSSLSDRGIGSLHLSHKMIFRLQWTSCITKFTLAMSRLLKCIKQNLAQCDDKNNSLIKYWLYCTHEWQSKMAKGSQSLIADYSSKLKLYLSSNQLYDLYWWATYQLEQNSFSSTSAIFSDAREFDLT